MTEARRYILLVTGASLLLASACRNDPPATPRPAPREPTDSAEQAKKPRKRARREEPAFSPRAALPLTPGARKPAPAPLPLEGEATPAPRDLNNEIRQAASGLGARCLSKQTLRGLGDDVHWSIEVHARENGSLTRAHVQARGVPDEEKRCIEEHVTHQRLRAPVPGAPRTITTALDINTRTLRTATPSASKPTPSVMPDGYERPDQTLPALGRAIDEQHTWERPEGFVSPSRVLPAQSPPAPENSLKPTLTLPAQGPSEGSK